MVAQEDRYRIAAEAGKVLGEGDPRVILAAERTLLAWIRTGLAMMGFGFLVAKFGLFLRELVILEGDQPAETPRWSLWIGAALVVLGVAVNLLAGIEHLRFFRAQDSVPGGFGNGYWMGIVIAMLLAVIGAMMVVHLFLL
jgi:putative membrane protein